MEIKKMGKFKVNDRVQVKQSGDCGVVVGVETVKVKNSKHVNVEYMVKLGDGFSNWKVFTKKELIRSKKKSNENGRVYKKVYDVVDGYKIMMYSKVIHLDWGERTNAVLKIGFSIYNPIDEYDETVGFKIARHRIKERPFCTMASAFVGEFNEGTTIAIMDSKAEYIKNNFDDFLNKKSTCLY